MVIINNYKLNSCLKERGCLIFEFNRKIKVSRTRLNQHRTPYQISEMFYFPWMRFCLHCRHVAMFKVVIDKLKKCRVISLVILFLNNEVRYVVDFRVVSSPFV
jgi:hypothetical protein